MSKKQFKTESKRLMDLMINSIYTHREIFLRELISNASDAIDKLYYRALTENISSLSRSDFSIRITCDKESRTLIISDNGCGMTHDELENNLGTIAKSGSLSFKKENEDKKDDIDIIGQFGVGFYSAFMVASHVKVISKVYGENDAWCWESDGIDGYTMNACEKASYGTDVVLTIKANTGEDQYDEYLDASHIRQVVKKYSDYIRYPIIMEVEKSRKIEKADTDKEKAADEKEEYETYTEDETFNSMIPLWKKKKNEVTTEEYNAFYQDKFMDYEAPARVINSNIEGVATYNALLFVPSHVPYDYYTRDFEKGLQLYASGVMIMEKCADLLPDYFSFVKGLVDSQDLSLNISREMLQHDKQLKTIATHLEKKIKSELLSMLKEDRESYEKFWKEFGRQIKYGVYSDFGMRKDLLQDLLMFYSSSEKKQVTLDEYVSRMKEDQKHIYYMSGESIERIEHLPQIEMLKDKGFEILYLTEDIDEFAMTMLRSYKEKEFKNASSEDIDIESAEEKEQSKKQSEENKDLLGLMKEVLEGKVTDVVLSNRLKSHPVCLSSKGALSLEMEKVLNAMPNDQKVKAELVLELNANHPVFTKMKGLIANDKDKIKTYSNLLYSQALLMEGMPIEDPVAFSNQICELMQ
jgi:Molecular chaperone, HSP90 family